jgi:hypothetical protein
MLLSRILDISCNILRRVVEELAASPFAINMQLDEIRDISQCNHLLVFVRYVHTDAMKEFLFCESLLESTKAVALLEIVKMILPNKTLTGKKIFIHFAQTELLGNTLVFTQTCTGNKDLPTSLK